MQTKTKQEVTPTVTISEAVGLLADIAELELDGEPIENPIVQPKALGNRKIDWMHKGVSHEAAIDFSRSAFRVVLNYLRNVWKTEDSYVLGSPAIEHVKTIMALVGEAAKKLDKYTALFDHSKNHIVTSLPEYKKLQEFYRTRIAHQIDDSTLSKWVLALSKHHLVQRQEQTAKSVQEASPLEHFFLDLESIKNDSEYDLLFIRKADGSRFFEPHLLRNVKLLSDFTYRNDGEGPLADVTIWQDRYFHKAAKELLNSIGGLAEEFYGRALRCKNQELVIILNNALMALMLCSDPQNQLKEMQIKSCQGYFQDFLTFLAEALHSDHYHRLVTYPPSPSDQWGSCQLKLIHTLCRGLYLSVRRFQYFMTEFEVLLGKAHLLRSREHAESLASQEIWKRLANDYAAMVKLFKSHPGGAIEKILQTLAKENCRTFDPMSQLNYPNHLFTLMHGEREVSSLHLPSPTCQEYINKVCVLDEFRGFLRSFSEDSPPKKHLLINLQDRTSWREHLRCTALENLTSYSNFSSSLAVATLSKQSDFYEQLALYDKNNHAHHFLSQVQEHIVDENSGYFFMPALKSEIVKEFTPKALQAIHRLFFSDKNILLREHRLAFIDIFDIFLILKLIDATAPDSFSLTCKDGVDIGGSANALLYTFLRMMSPIPMSPASWKQLNLLIYAPSIFVRERVMSSERFNRMLMALKTLELSYHELGPEGFGRAVKEAFGPLYKSWFQVKE